MADEQQQQQLLLADPALLPFLSDSFSPASYLNSTLSPPASSQSSTPQTLQTLHSTATALLSSLDAHLNRLQSTLSTLTDEILRATPRLSYELQVLRSDVISLADTLSSPRTRQLTLCLADISLLDDPPSSSPSNDTHNHNNKTTNNTNNNNGTAVEESSNKGEDRGTGTGTGTGTGKPQVLKRLETLTLVRRHLEDVIKVFGEAMEWTLTDSQKGSIPLPTTTTSSLGAYIPPSRSPSPSVMDGTRKKSIPSSSSLAAAAAATATGSDKFTDEISYLLLNGEVDKATQKVEDLARLCDVWKNTSEYEARLRFVENLRWQVMEATKTEETPDDDYDDYDAVERKKDNDRGVYTINLPDVSLPKDRYLGFINQFKQMRDSIGQSGL